MFFILSPFVLFLFFNSCLNVSPVERPEGFQCVTSARCSSSYNIQSSHYSEGRKSLWVNLTLVILTHWCTLMFPWVNFYYHNRCISTLGEDGKAVREDECWHSLCSYGQGRVTQLSNPIIRQVRQYWMILQNLKLHSITLKQILSSYKIHAWQWHI